MLIASAGHSKSKVYVTFRRVYGLFNGVLTRVDDVLSFESYRGLTPRTGMCMDSFLNMSRKLVESMYDQGWRKTGSLLGSGLRVFQTILGTKRVTVEDKVWDVLHSPLTYGENVYREEEELDIDIVIDPRVVRTFGKNKR